MRRLDVTFLENGRMAQVKFALDTDLLAKETKAVEVCWRLLSDLDTPARFRVINWLEAWARSESPSHDI